MEVVELKVVESRIEGKDNVFLTEIFPGKKEVKLFKNYHSLKDYLTKNYSKTGIPLLYDGLNEDRKIELEKIIKT